MSMQIKGVWVGYCGWRVRKASKAAAAGTWSKEGGGAWDTSSGGVAQEGGWRRRDKQGAMESATLYTDVSV